MLKIGRSRSAIFIVTLLFSGFCKAQESLSGQTPKRWGYEVDFQAGRVLVLDKYQKSYMRNKSDYSIGFKLNHATLPNDSDSYAHDYHYPTISLESRFSKNDGATMYRTTDYPSGNITPASYESHLGNSLALFGSFSYPILRTNRWELALTGNLGFAYSFKKYDKEHNVDNDMIGSHILFYAGGSLNATYRIAPSWGLKAGLDYWHISNGSTRQPNRSVNIAGPTLGIIYYPYYETLVSTSRNFTPNAFEPYWYLNMKAGTGIRTCIEDWDYYQYKISTDSPEYRKEHFPTYMCYSFQADMMYRYGRTGSIGGGIDIQYSSYSDHIAELDALKGKDCPHSPWSAAIDVKHQFFYKNVSFSLGAGVYLYHKMGDFAKRHDLFFFNRTGLHYSFPSLHNLTLGIEVTAHLAKAEFTELVISYPIKFKKQQ